MINFWLLMYLIFAPVFVGGVVLWFNRYHLQKKWWLYKHPQTVYKVKFFYDNKMFSEKFISTSKANFTFDEGTYNIKKESVLRKNWEGIVPSTKVAINKENCLYFEHYKVYHKEKYSDVPDKARLIGELHYIYNCPNPISYKSANELINDSKNTDKEGGVLYDLKSAKDLNHVEKNSLIDQLLTAEFRKMTLMAIMVVCGFILIAVMLLIALRLEWIETPLHAVCVNV